MELRTAILANQGIPTQALSYRIRVLSSSGFDIYVLHTNSQKKQFFFSMFLYVASVLQNKKMAQRKATPKSSFKHWSNSLHWSIPPRKNSIAPSADLSI